MTAFIVLTSSAVALTVLLARARPSAATPLVTALLVRFGLLAINYQIFRLIPGRGDANRFYSDAVVLSDYGFIGALIRYDTTFSGAYGSFAGALMAVLGPDRFVPQLFNMNLGILCVYWTYLLAARCGAKRRDARLAAFIVAIAPSIAQYSVVALREMVIVTPFMLGLVVLTNGRTPYQASTIIAFSLYCLVSSVFHGAMILAVFGIGAAIFIFQPTLASSLGSGRISRVRLATSTLMFVAISAAAASLISAGAVSKVDRIAEGGVVEEISKITTDAARGGSAYLTDTRIEGYGDIVASAPLRLFYFFFSPTPWMISSPSHLLGLMDVAIYAWCVWMLWRGYKARIFNQNMIVVIGVIATLAFVYAFGTSNAGTAIRHRAKFGYALVAVACASRSLSRQAQVRGRRGRYPGMVHGRHISVELP